jgi:hypothetical protein
VHAKVPRHGGGPGHARGWDPTEGQAAPESQGGAVAQGTPELGWAGSRPTG